MYLPKPLTLLRIALALVMGWAALRLAIAPDEAMPHRALGALEALGALLFLLPRTLRAGAWLLAASLLFATLLHFHTGQAPPPVFLVYAAGIYAVASRR